MTQSLVLLLWVAIAWGLFALFAAAAECYDRAGWRLPVGAEDANQPRRLRAGVVLGGVACLICAVSSVLQTDRPLLMAGMVVQGALMAAAGVTDLHKYRLPLPITLGGIALALIVAALAATPIELLGLGALWSFALVMAHARLTRGKMGWGDHLAMLWIGLAAPLAGALAVLAGHCATFLCAKLTGWDRRPVPIGGAWLLACAVLFALPAGFRTGTQPAPLQAGTRAAALQLPPARNEPAASARGRMLRDVLREAGFVTAEVAFAKDRAGRMLAARHAAARVAELAQLAAWAEGSADPHGSRLLNDLARALDQYDLASVDALSQQRAELLNALTAGSERRLSIGRGLPRP